jgi:hypothetical protein
VNRLIPYSGEVYAYLLAGYREAHLAIEIAALIAIGAFLVAGNRAGPAVYRIAAALLAAVWGWLAIGFYWQSYEPLNWAGRYMGWAAFAQSLLLLAWGTLAGRFRPDPRPAMIRPRLALGALVIAALAGPATTLLADGETVTAIQAVGVTPLATLAATSALLCLNREPVPFWLLPLPVLLLAWETIRAWTLGVAGDGVLVGVAVAVLVAWGRGQVCLDKQRAKSHAAE